MVWKKDLAKLKEEFKKEGPLPSRPPQPKAAPKPTGPLDLGEEDATFLAAMGLRPTQVRIQDKIPTPETAKPVEIPKTSPPEEGFLEVMTSLKGMKRTKPSVPLAAEPAIPVQVPAESVESVESVEPADPLPMIPQAESQATPSPSIATPPVPETQKKEPLLIHLAAGMAVEVDGVLDLRGHSRADALERLKERVLDGQALGWRTCHVLFGHSEELANAFAEFLRSPEASSVARYAQAPIPMGGSQARILYYSGPGTTTKENP